ncbi:Bud site selection protein bud4 [Coemansia sp. RSA 988]|nr:Bud site selection protein bud4 [Coemansia sp. RSA 988]
MLHFRHPQPRRTRRQSADSDSDFDPSDGEDIPDSVVGPIEIPKSPSHQQPSARIGSTPGMRAPTHINFSASPHSPRSAAGIGAAAQGRGGQHRGRGTADGLAQQLYRQWFGAIAEGRSIQVHSILADHPKVLDMRRRETTPFHMALTHIASEWLGNDTSGMDGLQVAIMGYKNAYANWRLGNGAQTEQMAGMSADQMKEHVAVREVILGALIDAITAEQLDTHQFGRQQNTTLHLAAFYNDANLVERLLRQGAAVDIPNGMGFLPSGITNDKPTLQWLEMYRGQVRGSRYQTSQMQHYTPESDHAMEQFGEAPSAAADQQLRGSAMAIPNGSQVHFADSEPDHISRAHTSPAHFAESELELTSLDHFSDEEEGELAYVRRGSDQLQHQPQGENADTDGDNLERDSVSDEFSAEASDDEQGSVVSSSDRCSLGLGTGIGGGGGVRTAAMRSSEGLELRKRAFDNSARPSSRASNASGDSETPPTTANSMSYTASVGSYHTANGALSDGVASPQPDSGRSDGTVRISVDPRTFSDEEIDDIFSDADDDVVQLEPSFVRSGAGLSQGNRRSPEGTQAHSAGAQAAASMQSLSNAMARAALGERPSVEAYPMMIHHGETARVPEDSAKLESSSKGGGMPRAGSPFMLRDSLYEMIMGRSVSRLSMGSMGSIGSANSNVLSNSSTVAAPKDQQPVTTAVQPVSPTSPTSAASHVSPTSTTFEDSTASPSQTIAPSPSNEVSFSAATKASVPLMPEPVPEDSDADGASSDDSNSAVTDHDEGFDGRSPSPVIAPRPTAASLFASPDETEDVVADTLPSTVEDVETYSWGDNAVVDIPSQEPISQHPVKDLEPVDVGQAAAEPISDSTFLIGRIGRRQGRATVEQMVEEPATPPAVDSNRSLDKLPPKTPEQPPFENALLPLDAPLTREKRDQYLQTLISRNTMRGASPSKRATHGAMLQALRSSSPAPPTVRGNPHDAADGERPGDDARPASPASQRVPSTLRHASKRSEGAIDFAARSPSALGSREYMWESDSAPRPLSSLHTREALAASGASINGRMRSNSVANVQPPPQQQQPRASPAARKVSPSLATLKTRSLVSNAPARAPPPPALDASPSRAWVGDGRVRAMSTPVDAQAPVFNLPKPGDTGPPPNNASSARIGRVAALSQNFEKQTTTALPRISIPSRAAGSVRELAEKAALGVASAPLSNMASVNRRPPTRSNSLSSSHSAGGHGQTTIAGSSHADHSARPPPHSAADSSGDTPPDDAGEENADTGGGGTGGIGGGTGGGDDGDDEKRSPDPRAALLEPVGTESNDSTSTHNSSTSTGRGLAANIRVQAAESALLASHGSTDIVGSSIFSSTDSKSSSSAADALDRSEPSRLPAPTASASRPSESESERKRRFRELANRRKSGTLEKISNSGMVKNRTAMFGPTSDPTIRSSSSARSSGSPSARRSKVQFAASAEATTKAQRSSTSSTSSSSKSTRADRLEPAFLGLRGEEPVPHDSATNDVLPSSLSSVDVDLEKLRQANRPPPHPSLTQAQLQQSSTSVGVAPQLTRGGSGRSGIDADLVLERSLTQAHAEASQAAEQSAQAVWSRSSSDKSKPSSASGDDSLHILSSLDTNSTPGSTPIDSTQDTSKVGLLAQYDLEQRRLDRRRNRKSRDSEHSYASASNYLNPDPAFAEDDVHLGFSTSDGLEYADQTEDVKGKRADDSAMPDFEDQLSEGFQTMMPLRPRYNPQAVFGLSIVAEEEEESKNPSMIVSDPPRSTAAAATAANIPEMPSPEFREAAAAAAIQPPIHAISESGRTPLVEMQERQSPGHTLRGLRSALGPHLAMAPIYRGLGSVSIPDAVDDDPISPEAGIAQEVLDAAISGSGSGSIRLSNNNNSDDIQSRTASLGSHSFDPYLVFGYNSEDNSTMASRSSLDPSDIFNPGRPGSSASRVMYMHPLDPPDSEGYSGDSESRSQQQQHQQQPPIQYQQQHQQQSSPQRAPVASTSRMTGRRLQDISSFSSRSGSGGGDESSSSSSAAYSGKGKAPVHRTREMEQISPADSLPHAPVTTVEEIEEDLSTDEEPIPKILYLESQEFEGYVPIGYKIREYREELRKEKRLKKEAAKKGITLPKEPRIHVPTPPLITSLSFLGITEEPAEMMIIERDMDMVDNMPEDRVTEHPALKRVLESSTISSRRLREEFDATMAGEDPSTIPSTSRGTIKQLPKRPRTSSISNMFVPPDEHESKDTSAHPKRRSFLDSVEIPMSEVSSESASTEHVPYRPPVDPVDVQMLSQDFHVPGEGRHRITEYDPALMTAPRKRLVLRSQPRTFSERVMGEIDELNVSVKTDVHGSVRVRSAGQYAYQPEAATVRPSTIPQYVSQLKGVPAGPFFMPPKASIKSGYLYMRILSIEDMEEPPNSIYFVIRNGIDTLATTPVNVDGPTGTTINQEFRILTDPNVSITMWMRFRSDAIIHRNASAYGPPGCMPPLLRKLVRRNTRSRNSRWQCPSSADSVFDFADNQSRVDPGARRAGPMARAAGFVARRPPPKKAADGYPERVSSAFMSQSGGRYPAAGGSHMQQSQNGYNDPRSLNATQAPSSVFYDPGDEAMDFSSSNKGLAQAQFKEETRGVAVVHVGEMIEEVFLRGLVDSWDVENVWESRKGARLHLQLFFIPECPLFREEELPRTLSECEMAMEICGFHNRTLNSGFMSQRGGDTRFWRRRYFRLIGGFLFAYHEESKEPRCFIDLNDATRVVDLQAERTRRANVTPSRVGNLDLMRTQRMRRRPTHKRNNSDHSSRDGAATAAANERRTQFTAIPSHNYASDSEPPENVDIADPILQQSTMRRSRRYQQQQHRASDATHFTDSSDPQRSNVNTDSGIVSVNADGAPDNGMQHSFSIEFGEGGLIEFYTETEQEKHVWVEIIKRVVGNIPKIPSWLIKLLHADVSERIESGTPMTSDSSLGDASIPSSKFQELAHPLTHLPI